MDEAAENQPHPKVDLLIADITKLMDDAELMLRDSTSQHAEEQIELLRARYDDVRTHLSALCASARQVVAASAQRADRTIRAHPYQSLAIALGLGVLLGAVLTRDRS